MPLNTFIGKWNKHQIIKSTYQNIDLKGVVHWKMAVDLGDKRMYSISCRVHRWAHAQFMLNRLGKLSQGGGK